MRWGSGDSVGRTLQLEGVRELDPETVRTLVQWGVGDPAPGSLSLFGVESLDEESARILAQWERGNSDWRELLLRANAVDAVDDARRR